MTSLRYKLVQWVLRTTRYRNKMIKDAANQNARHTTPSGKYKARFKRSEFDGQAVWTVHPKSGPTTRAYIHQHGGGYVYGLQSIHWMSLCELADYAGITVIVPDYPLPPHTPEFMHDWAARQVQSEVEARGAANVLLGGCSAGGNLALVIAQMRHAAGQAALSPLILWSPWVDLTPKDTITKDDDYEALITPYGLEPAIANYAPNHDRRDPMMSPAFADMDSLPMMHIITGARDILHPQIMAFSAKAKAAGKLASEIVEPEYGHYWMFYPVPDRHKTLRQIAGLLQA